MERQKQNWTISVFALLLAGGLLLHLLLPDAAVSTAERRKLAQAPSLTGETLLSGKFASELETYLLDQFPGREGFRTLKAVWTFYVLGQKDNNGIYLSHGSASKLDPVLDEKQVERFVERMNQVRETCLADSRVYCAVIPDKNYYLAQTGGYPVLDYGELFRTVEEGLPWAVHVDLTGSLMAADYYATDLHWRQEGLDRVMETLGEALEVELPPPETYEAVTLPGFRGGYYGQSALPLPAEDLVYLENPVTRAAQVTGPELDGIQPVYAPEKLTGMDGYDVFLHGAQAVEVLENPLAETDRELIIFRDSFASSLAPLLLPGYRTVTLVDLRYVSSAALQQFVDFHGQDVLLLYSTTVINSAGILR